MIESNAVFIDANVLVYASVRSSPWHDIAITAINAFEAERTSLWISPQVIREYLVTMTRPQFLRERTPHDVWRSADKLRQHYRMAYETDLVAKTLVELVSNHQVLGKQVHDANLVATCLAHGISRLLTHNPRDFKRFASHLTIEPLQP